MKAQHSTSSSLEKPVRFVANQLSFGDNGPYNFSCRVREITGIRGASGVGKTLLLRALADLDDHEGQILLDGKECISYPAPEWRRRVSLVPAESRWWHTRVISHIAGEAALEEAEKYAVALGFAPDVLNWDVARLSTGEKQRLSVVRALVQKPAVLLLDEVGSGLDPDNLSQLNQVIRDYMNENDSPVLWVSHDREQLDRMGDMQITMHKKTLEITELQSRG